MRNQALADYQKVYAAAYGVSEKVAELIPFMLEAFLDSDRAFTKARKEGLPEAEKRAAKSVPSKRVTRRCRRPVDPAQGRHEC